MAAVPKAKVMLVDDSAILRQVLAGVLNADPRLEVIATANDPIAAQHRMQSHWPDVIVLDVEMPRMDGLTFLRQIMAERPTPVVICSTLTSKGATTTMQALEAGAVAFFTKPTLGLRDFLEHQAAELCRVVAEAALAKARSHGRAAAHAVAGPRAQPALTALARTTDRIVAVGASTGGTQALQRVLSALPRTAPGMVVVQHMPPGFTAALAVQLSRACDMEVREAADGDRVHDGLVLIAPGGRHMELQRSGAHYRVKVFDAPPVNRHRPSVDVLLRSVAQCAGANALGIMLTGMGADGARGLEAMHTAGAHTLAQDEQSCVVFGMPKEAIARGAVDQVLPLSEMAGGIVSFQSRTAI